MSEAAYRYRASAPIGERRRIVIADDHEPTRVLMRTLIELEGMQVVGEAEDGSEAVALALEQGPDVVLLDVNMPGLDGLGAAGIIRAARPRIQLLLHTGEPLETARGRAAALQLPLADKRDLRATIEQLAQQTEPHPAKGNPEPRTGAMTHARQRR
jgi:CheY-like chemotaxis protein